MNAFYAYNQLIVASEIAHSHTGKGGIDPLVECVPVPLPLIVFRPVWWSLFVPHLDFIYLARSRSCLTKRLFPLSYVSKVRTGDDAPNPRPHLLCKLITTVSISLAYCVLQDGAIRYKFIRYLKRNMHMLHAHT